MNLTQGKSIYIQSYKHDGSLHRTWAMGYVIEANENRVIAVTNKSWVTEANGRHWYTREPAICYFYPNRWFNVISMIRKTGIFYYCNLASPSIWDGEALKHIDYDLDVKVFPDGKTILLDEDEYQQHSQEMNYPQEIKTIIEDELKILYSWIQEKKGPFNNDEVNRRLDDYLKMLMENNYKEYLRVKDE